MIHPRECSRFDRCNAPLCPLDDLMEKREYLSGEKICPFVLDYMDKDRDEVRYLEQVETTKPVWESKLGKKTLVHRVKQRKNVREYFAKRKAQEAK